MRSIVRAAVIALLVAFAVPATAQDLVEEVRKGCQKELDSFCKGVTPGEGRVLACLYAFGDQLSGQCEYALYDAAVQLERAVAALTYVANECDADLEKHCANIAPGEGRLLACLEKKSSKLDKRCTQALQDVGAKK